VTQDERSLSGYAKPSAARMTVPAFPLTRILIITDAWLPQVNGVVRSIEVLVREAPALGVEIEILAADGFRTVPLPTYPQLRVAVTRPDAVRRRIEELKPDFIHLATEGMRMVRLPESRPPLYDLLPHSLPRVSCCATSSAEQICLCTASSVPQCWLWHDGVD
jgi:hypothetical protein